MSRWHDSYNYDAFVGSRSWYSVRNRATQLAQHFQYGELNKSTLHYDRRTRIARVTASQNDHAPTLKLYELLFSIDDLAKCRSLEDIESLLMVSLVQALITDDR